MHFDATYLAYSGGVQSHALLEMVLRGEIEQPPHFFVVNADPGMEDERSYAFVAAARARCAEAGIEFLTANTPEVNLYQQLIGLQASGRDRMDHPPYFTRNRETGKKGRLKQKCTREFKIRPMRRCVRDYLARHFPLRRRPLPRVAVWIGFASDEMQRAAKLNEKPTYYIQPQFPLINRGMDKVKVEGFYLRTGVAKPPRSVCVACFANGLAYFEDMYLNRPDDWDRAVNVDEAVRNLSAVGVRDEVYVSASLVPLKDLPGKDFLRGTPEGKEHRCNSGVCFL